MHERLSSSKFEDPHATRISIDQSRGGLEIHIPARRNWAAIIFLFVWLGGWVIGLVSVTEGLFFEDNKIDPFLLLWLCGWILGGLFAISAIAWMLFGYEHITASLLELSHTYCVQIPIKRKFYEPHSISGLRFAKTKEDTSLFQRRRDHNPFDKPNLHFDYGAKTISFGRGVDHGEARAIIKALSSATRRDLEDA